jgi:hypothetical protein
MATDKDAAKLNRYIRSLDSFLRKQYAWQQKVTNNLRRLNRKSGPLGPGPTITNPPKPPPKP